MFRAWRSAAIAFRRPALAAIAYNIKKVKKFTTRKVKIDTKALQINLQNAFFICFKRCQHLYRDTYHLHFVKNKIRYNKNKLI